MVLAPFPQSNHQPAKNKPKNRLKRIYRTHLKSVVGKTVSSYTITKWLEYCEDAFLLERALRFDIRGKRYIGTHSKYYFIDPGIRNAILDFRQMDKGHLMENIIYMELRRRGGSVDVGMIESSRRGSGLDKKLQPQEVDFVVNKGSNRIYIQSSYSLYDETQMDREKRPLMSIPDSFRKILVSFDGGLRWNDENGILHLNVFDFFQDTNILS